MGNTLTLPCVCQEAEVAPAAAAAGDKRRRRKRPACRSGVRAAASRAVVPLDAPEDGGEAEEEIKKAWPGCRVEPAGDGEAGVRVKVVMRRKDAAELMARLEERGAAERKARMEELNGELAVGTASPCRDHAWRPRLASIPEN